MGVHFTKGKNFSDFMFASLDKTAGLVVKEEFLTIRVDIFEKGGKNENAMKTKAIYHN